MASYDDGLYTPWGEAETPAAPVVEATAAAAVEPTYEAPYEAPASSTYVWSEPEPSSTYVYEEPSSSYVYVEPSSTYVYVEPTTWSTVPPAETSTPVPTTSSSLSSHTSSAASLSRSSNLSTTLARPSLTSTLLPATSSGQPFKIVWLTPVFVLLPIIIAFAVAGCLYGRCWGHREPRRREQSGAGGGWFGGGSMKGERGILSPEEEGGLVEGKWVGDDEDEKYVETRESGWRGFVIGSLSRRGRNDEREAPFRAVPYASLEEPFIAPGSYATPGKNYLTPSAEDHSTPERGWTWGAKPVSPNERRGSKGLGAAWQWPTKRYRAKSASSKRSGRSEGSSFGGKEREDSTMGRWRSAAGLDNDISPSLYSPTVENGQYQGFRDVDDDADVDEMLAESRTGHGNERARRFMSGTQREDDFPASTSRGGFRDEPETSELGYAQVQQRSPSKNAREGRHANDGFRIEVELPQNLPPTHNSPTKSAVIPLVRPPPPITPTKTANLLFSYDSPASAPRVPRSPLPIPPPRRNPSAPLSPEARPGLFFTPPSPVNVGAPMPAFKSDAMRASESAYSLTGVRGLVFGGEEEEEDKAEILVETKEERAARKQERAARKEAKRRSRAEMVPPVEQIAVQPHKIHRVAAPTANTAPFADLLPAHQPSAPARHSSIPPPRTSSVPTPQPSSIPTERAPRPQSNVVPTQRTTPSRVRNQVDALELAHAASPPPSPSRPSTSFSPARAALPHGSVPVGGIMPSRSNAPAPPTTKLGRSATLLERQKEDEEQRRIGRMLMQRSKTLSRIVVESHEEEVEPVKKRRPLSEGAGLSSALAVEEERRRAESFGGGGEERMGGSKVRGMDAMVRRSVPASESGLKSAMKGGWNEV